LEQEIYAEFRVAQRPLAKVTEFDLDMGLLRRLMREGELGGARQWRVSMHACMHVCVHACLCACVHVYMCGEFMQRIYVCITWFRKSQ
jgi:hypothetical protein